MSGASSVAVVVPALNEADRIGATLDAIGAQRTDREVETLVVDGGSSDGTPRVARDRGARVIAAPDVGIGGARARGAAATASEVIVFIDADTVLDPAFVERTTAFLEREDLAGATARCRVDGPRRAALPQAIVNHLFPRFDRPILPGFATVVRRSAYEAAGGYPDVPNEDKAFSRRLARVGPTAVHPDRLVTTSGRRVAQQGLLGTLAHYVAKDARALHDGGVYGDRRDDLALAALLVAPVAGLLQIGHGLALGHPGAALAGLGFFGGVALCMRGITRPRFAVLWLVFLAVQLGDWLAHGTPHGLAGVAIAAVLTLFALVLVGSLALSLRATTAVDRPLRT